MVPRRAFKCAEDWTSKINGLIMKDKRANGVYLISASTDCDCLCKLEFCLSTWQVVRCVSVGFPSYKNQAPSACWLSPSINNRQSSKRGLSIDSNGLWFRPLNNVILQIPKLYGQLLRTAYNL